jgi:hypothetical protein
VTLERMLAMVSKAVGEGYEWVHVESGLSGNQWIYAVVSLVVVVILWRTFLSGSGIGRGRRYRRGYMVAYREERGKLAAREAARAAAADHAKPSGSRRLWRWLRRSGGDVGS